MTKRILPLAVLLLGLALLAAAAPQSDGYSDAKQLSLRLRRIEQAHPGLVELTSIGKTGGGRNIWAVRLSNEKKGNPDEKPALMVVGNLEADRLAGTESILTSMQTLLDNYSKVDSVTTLLDDCACYFIPRANPDGTERFFASVRWDGKGNQTPTDEDHDGLVDEDGPEDMNGDGLITLIRVKDPKGTWMPDPDDARLMKKADPARGESGVWTIYPEGVDSDKDGCLNEDPAGGVNLDRNFPHAYPYNAKDAGRYMTSEAETRAILDFCVAHRNIGVILTYSPCDNLTEPPKPAREKPETSGDDDSDWGFRTARKAETAVNPKDVPYFKKSGDLFKACVGASISPEDRTNKPQGAFHQWAYFQYGALALTTPAWRLPEDEKGQQENRREDNSDRTKKEAASGDLRLIRWFDANKVEGRFVNWTPYKHPDLGDVEIGGFAPFTRANPPTSHLAQFAAGHSGFITALGALLPRLELAEIKVDKQADGVFTISATVKNSGFLPTALAHGVKARAVKPILLKLEGNGLAILAGKRIVSVDTLEGSGGAETATWIVKGRIGSRIQLVATSEKAGRLTQSIELK